MAYGIIQRPIKYAVRWFGVLGLAISLAGGLDAFVQISEYTRLFIERWHTVTNAICSQILAFWNIKIGILGSAYLNASLFSLAISLSSIRFYTLPLYVKEELHRWRTRHEVTPATQAERTAVIRLFERETAWHRELLDSSGRLLIFAVFLFLQAIIISGTVLKFDPDLFNKPFSTRFEPASQPLTKVEQEMEDLQFLDVPQASINELRQIDGFWLWFKRAQELGVLKQEHVGLAVAILVGGIANFMLLFPKPLMMFRRLIDVGVLLLVAVVIGAIGPYLMSLRGWIDSIFKP